MSENRIEGVVRKAAGAAKEAAGKAVGNTRLKGESAAEKAVGTVQIKIGKARDTVGDAIKK